MGILEKGICLVGGIAVASALFGNKKKQLAKLDTEFARTTAEYQEEKSKLEEKIKNGNQKARKKLAELEREYFVEKTEYEGKRRTLLPQKTKAEEEREAKEFEQSLEIEKIKAIHDLEIEKTKTVYGLELEKDRSYHEWDVQDAQTIHSIEMDRDKNHHVWDLEKSESMHKMDMEKIELAAKLGAKTLPSNNSKNEKGNIFCSQCGYKNFENSKFCSSCGKPLSFPKFCTGCGASLEENIKFCPMCGQPSQSN